MDQHHVLTHKNELLQQIHLLYAGKPLLTKDNFFQETWNGMCSLTHYNKGNPLMRGAVARYPDLLPRAFVIVTMLYGAYMYVPSKMAVTKEFIELLDNEDLIEKELRVAEYAMGKNGFYPGLPEFTQAIRDLFSGPEFDESILPRTPHHAYTVFVLNHADKLGNMLTRDELFDTLFLDDTIMKSIQALASNKK